MPVCKNRAWEKLEQLSFVRVAGTPEELKAAELLKAECEKIEVEAVIEDFEYDAMLRELEDLEKLAVFAHNLNKKVYVTMNIIPHDEDLNTLEE